MTTKIIVLDDDPTGSQTVHGCLLLTQWDPDTLALGLRDPSPIMFVLTNTRSLSPEQAAATTRSVCQSLRMALAATQVADFIVVSRSDSTLRGHYPIETDVIAEELGSFDAHFLIPAFFEGGRITRNSIHYLKVEGNWIPVHETEFARDSVFGYRHSYLPDYVAEKTQGRIPAEQVQCFTLTEIRDPDSERRLGRLRALQGNCCGVVDGEEQADLDQFAADLKAVAAEGKRFLLRSAASILTALAQLPPQPIAAQQMSQLTRTARPGVVMVGSHVQKTTQQLDRLLQEPDVEGIPIEIELLAHDPNQAEQLLKTTLADVDRIQSMDKTPVVYTSRKEITFADAETRLAFGQAVSELLMEVERGLPADIGFLISKGGITSNDTLSKGLAVSAIRLLGQIAPGVSVVQTASDHPHFPQLPVVLFPGNVGDADTLAQVYRRLRVPKNL
ncbi:MAG: four-carbon acid sugar kinase family protein [Synechococcaceae cyanobacterium SM2_3_2]|nr:four-carbon acid sugar kinase family protein [Synechococcaceae cyanobacterium SM2_3_2]